jgi:glycosyltransferase involved in cell wall biosynthesis
VKIVTYRGIVGNESFLNPFSWMRYLNPRVDRIVCVAEAVRRYFIEMRLLGLKVPIEKVVTIYKGHDLSWYRDTPVDRRALGIPTDSFVVGCVANWRPRKGVEVLLEACRSLPPDASIHVLLVGNMDSPGLKARIDASPYRNRIHVLGFRADAPAVIAACDAAVLPSIKREGLPKTVIEAMAYGVPPIVTDCGGSPELVVDGVSGLVVPVRDPVAISHAIRTLYEDAALRARLGRAARERIRDDFRIEDTVARTLALYRDLAANDGEVAI